MRCALLFLCAAAVVAQPAVAQEQGSDSHDRSDCPEVMRPLVRAFSFHVRDNRPALGISTTSGGMRDTLGLLVTGIADNGPADKAGIEEGDRLQAVNGTDLRLAPADASDREMRGLMARRLIRVLDKLKPGDAVDLRVYSDGKVHTVKVTTEKASEAFQDDAGFGLTQGFGPVIDLQQVGDKLVPPGPPVVPDVPRRMMRIDAPVPPVPPVPPSAPSDAVM